MYFYNKFFATEAEAKAFQKTHGGRLIALKPKSRAQTRADCAAEMLVAFDGRGEVVDKDKTPFCVAWNGR